MDKPMIMGEMCQKVGRDQKAWHCWICHWNWGLLPWPCRWDQQVLGIYLASIGDIFPPCIQTQFWLVFNFADGVSPGTTGLTSCTGTGRGTATVCGTSETTTTTTAPPSSPVSTGREPSTLQGSTLRRSMGRVRVLTSMTIVVKKRPVQVMKAHGYTFIAMSAWCTWNYDLWHWWYQTTLQVDTSTLTTQQVRRF